MKIEIHDAILHYKAFSIKRNQRKYNKWKEKQGDSNQIKPRPYEEITNTCLGKTAAVKRIKKYTNN